MWHAWTIGLCGLWCILMAFLATDTSDGTVVVCATGMISGFAAWRLRILRPVRGWCAAILALWLIVTAAAPVFVEGTTRQLNVVIIGVVMTILGFTSLGGERHSHGNTRTLTGAGGA